MLVSLSALKSTVAVFPAGASEHATGVWGVAVGSAKTSILSCGMGPKKVPQASVTKTTSTVCTATD